MIAGFRNKALRRFYETGDTKGLNADWRKRLRLILARLDASAGPGDMDLPGLRLHPLKGDLRGYWSVSLSGNWRVIFRFEDGAPRDVDLVDYH
jgi:proteic killer suppression protein